ncbi:MAG: family 10 glycosylhydrolase [Planctomycetales bacterium]|nr:family 10 glycosylhydrolase [Planctomycetales bacterium]
MLRSITLGILVGSLGSCYAAEPLSADVEGPPPLRREFRAAWIATVANIDWPSKPGLPVQQLKSEMELLLATAERLRLNAVIYQVRPACDAMYKSRLEPWSAFLTGTEGQPPPDGFDPLEFLIAEAHSRGVQVHAWLNPYRASHPSSHGAHAADHVSKTMPSAVVQYGPYGWLDPGSKAAEDHTLQVIADVVRRYDVDGVHFDDYFYPYPVKKKDEEGKDTKEDVPFPDDRSWQEYQQNAPADRRMSRDDWRRENVNRLIRRVGEEVHREKPWVLYGVSPFGIWRPGNPQGIVGFDPYAALYADSRLWLQEGWVDYFTPQLYWPIESEGQSYPKLMNWWAEQNRLSRALWPGLFTSKIQREGQDGFEPDQIVRQVEQTQQSSGAGGNVHFSIKALSKNYGGVADALAAGPYALPAAIPVCTSRESGPAPEIPRVEWSGDQLNLKSAGTESPWQWAVHFLREGQWSTLLVPACKATLRVEDPSGVQAIAVRSIDRLGRESKVCMLHPDQ